MATVRKANKQLTINDNEIAAYLKDGYDRIDKDGKVVEKATGGKTVTIAEYNKAIADKDAEIAKLKGKLGEFTKKKERSE